MNKPAPLPTVDPDNGQDDARRKDGQSSSTSSAPPGGNKRRSSIQQSLEEVFHSHLMSMTALCSSLFTLFYILMSVFPYSGYMALFLIKNGNSETTITRETVGLNAGILTSSFMIGRAISGYPWGQLADVYGRKFVLVFSLAVSAIGSVLFGCARSYTSAVLIRFLMGLGNGIMAVSRTSISEIAKGDRDLEQAGVAALTSMIGYGMLIAPTVGGLLSEPLRQYPNSTFYERYESVLEPFPFLLPNLIAAILSVISLVAIILCVEETLPISKRRSWMYAASDLGAWVCQSCFARCCTRILPIPSSQTPTSIYVDRPPPPPSSSLAYDDGYTDGPSTELISVTDAETWEEEWDEAKKILDSSQFSVAAPLVCSPRARATLMNALHRPSMNSHLTKDEQDPTKLVQCFSEQNRRRHSLMVGGGSTINATLGKRYSHQFPITSSFQSPPKSPDDDEETPLLITGQKGDDPTLPPPQAPSIEGLMANKQTRLYLISSWVYAFANVAQSEAFPLFAMSQVGRGLGMAEKDIGIVGTLSGLLYLIGQYVTFSTVMKYMGLVQAMRYGALFANLPVILIPISLYLPQGTGDGEDWVRIVYLSVLMGVAMISGSVYLGCSTIGANRTVDATQRATMNGLSSVGTSIGRGMGPIFAGVLVTSSMREGSWVPPALGAWVVYAALLAIGMVAYWTTVIVPEEEETREENGKN